jgi:hypothetical protein
MANKKVTDLNEALTIANNDWLMIVDVSSNESKKIQFSNLTFVVNIVDDITPQLGGNLDLNGFSLITTANGNIQISPNGTGRVRIGDNTKDELFEIAGQNSSSTGATLRLSESSGADPNGFSFVLDSTNNRLNLIGDNLDNTIMFFNRDGGVQFNDDIDVVGLIDYKQADANIVALGNLGSTESIDWSAGVYQEGTLDANVTITHTNEVTGRKITLVLAYDGSAQRTITWSDVDKWAGGSAPDSPSTTGEVLVVTMLYIGTTCYATAEVFS